MNKRVIIYALSVFILMNCHQNKDDVFFYGEIYYFDDSRKITKNVSSILVPLYGQNFGVNAIYDSLLICWNPKLADYFFNVFNVDTGEEIGSFVRRGVGPEDAIAVNTIFQFYKNYGDLMTILYAVNEGRLMFWNITQSIVSGTTVFDAIVPFNAEKRAGKEYNFIFYQNNNTILAYAQSILLNNNEITTPYYEKYEIYPEEKLLQAYPIYLQRSIRNTSIFPLNLLYSWDVVKPDGTKIVQAMRNLAQINIIDIKTGNNIGYRLKNTHGFAYLETNMRGRNIYFNSVHADDKYIYASYWGKSPWGMAIDAEIPNFNTIHVFDWNGNHLYELKTDRVFFRIWLDHVRNRLYGYNHDTDEVYYIDLTKVIM